MTNCRSSLDPENWRTRGEIDGDVDEIAAINASSMTNSF
jgi:hypothetical protein